MKGNIEFGDKRTPAKLLFDIGQWSHLHVHAEQTWVLPLMSWVKVGPVCAHSELGHLILVQVKVGVHTASFCLKAAVLLQLSTTAATKTI